MGMITHEYPSCDSKKYQNTCVKSLGKRGSATDVSLSCKSFKKTFFTDHLCTTAPEFCSSHECMSKSCDDVMQRVIF